LPLRNTNLRDAAFTAVSHLNKGTVSVAASGSAKMSDFVKTMDAMQRAGITSFTFRTVSAAESTQVADLVKTGYVTGRAGSTSSTEPARSGGPATVTNK
jgi:L-arabinose isomerase